MSFDYFLILLPVVLAVGALIKVLTSKPPAYKPKRKEYDSRYSSGGDSGETGDINRSSPNSRRQHGDGSDTPQDSAGDGEGCDD